MPAVTLIIPKLFEPLLLWNQDFLFKAEAPFLSQLLSAYTLSYVKQSKGFDASLFANLGFSAGELPSAVYRIQMHSKIVKKGGGVYSVDDGQARKKQLLCADPVHLVVGINDITLTQRITDVSEADAKEIISALNAHFSQEGFEFIYGAEGQWYLSLDADDTLATTPVDNVLRKNIVSYLPQSDSVNWKLIQNEVQMLLHSLSFNSEREIQGFPMLNSLWFWGGGQPQECKKSVDMVLSTSQSKGLMLAKAAACECKTIADSGEFENLLGDLKGANIVILDTLQQASIADDLDAYQQALSTLDSTMFKPLYLAWKAGDIELSIDACDGNVLTPMKSSSWVFWRKPSKALIDIAKDISL